MDRPPFVYALLLLSLVISTTASNTTTCTLAEVKANGTLLADCDVLCKPAEWTDFIWFYIGNYLAHVATVRGEPGQIWVESILRMLSALFFPSSGLLTGSAALISGAKMSGKSPLQVAAKARALYMVVKDSKLKQSKDCSELELITTLALPGILAKTSRPYRGQQK